MPSIVNDIKGFEMSVKNVVAKATEKLVGAPADVLNDEHAAQRIQAQREALHVMNKTEPAGMADTDGEARGWALAQSAIMLAKSQASEWIRIVLRLMGADTFTRVAFVKGLNKHKAEMQAHVKANPDDARYAAAKRSAIVRFSQLKQVADALNAGYIVGVKCDPQTHVPLVNGVGDPIPVQPFDTIVAESRLFLASQGKGTTQGRPSLSFADKVKKLAEKEGASVDDLKEAEAVLRRIERAISKA